MLSILLPIPSLTQNGDQFSRIILSEREMFMNVHEDMESQKSSSQAQRLLHGPIEVSRQGKIKKKIQALYLSKTRSDQILTMARVKPLEKLLPGNTLNVMALNQYV